MRSGRMRITGSVHDDGISPCLGNVSEWHDHDVGDHVPGRRGQSAPLQRCHDTGSRLGDFVVANPDRIFGDESYDVAIHYAAVNWTGPDAECRMPNAECICDELFVPVASPAYRDKFRLFDANSLLTATLLQQADRPGLWSEWFDASGINCPDPYRGPILDRFSMTIGAAHAGLGVALVPMFLVATELNAGALVALSTRLYAGAGAYYALIPPSKLRSAQATAFREWLVREGRASRQVLSDVRTE